MNIIISGCGKIGTTLLACLLEEGHDVVAMDSSADVIGEIANIYDVMTVCGNGADCDTLQEAGVEKTDVFIATTGSDEANMLSCFLARKMGAKHTIARIRTPEYTDRNLSFLRQQLDLSMVINPDRLAAHELFNILKLPAAANVETFSQRNFEMVEVILKDNSVLDGMRLFEMRKKYDADFLVCVVQRGEEVYIPGGSFVLRAGDRIGLTATPAEITKLMKMFGQFKKSARSVMILGASRTAYYLSRSLLNSGTAVKIVEMDKDRCEEFSAALDGATVIRGDGAQEELLMEEGVGDMDAFVSLTGMDEENLLMSFFAASKGVGKTITKVNREEFLPMAEKLGLECTVSPKHIVSDIVLRYMRALQNSEGSKMETLYKLMDGKAEALEFNVLPDFEWTNIPLKKLKLRENALIAGILRKRHPIIPRGDDVILPGDKVVVLIAGESLQDLSDVIREATV